MSFDVKKKDMRERKLSYIGVVLSSDTAGMKVEIAYKTKLSSVQ